MTAPIRTQRWTAVCLDCWQEAFPDRYAPVASGWNDCAVCGYSAYTIYVAPVDLNTITRAVVARQAADDAALYRVETRSGSGY